MALPSISPLLPADLDDLMPLERRVFPDPWTRRAYLSDLTQNALATHLVLRPADEGLPPILAWGGFWLLLDEAHIATIAAHPDWRRCGLGKWMLLALLETAIVRGAARATLEVRIGNVAGQGLYAVLGFAVAGHRRHYYRDGEDALIMTTPPLAGPGMQARLAAARTEALARLAHCFNGERPHGDK